MRIERTKNSIKGFKTGLINKMVTLLLPFIVRTVLIRTFGMEYLGLNSLFLSILNILNLAELGVGSAISFSLYNAIAKDDKNKIRDLVNLYKKLYRVIGLSIFGIGMLVLPFLKSLCNSDIPSNVNIYAVYILYVLNTTLGYLLFAYKNSLFVSHQKNYITNNISTFVNVLLNVLQCVVLIVLKNYYLFVLVMPITTIINNLLIKYYAIKKFPNYNPEGNIDKEEKKQIYSKVKALFYYKIGGVVLVSVDSIVINKYLGLSILGRYNSYYYVISTLFGFLQIITSSMLAGVGNSITTDSIQKNKDDFDRLNFIMSWIIGFCTICLLCLYQPFMKLWIGKPNMFSLLLVVYLSIYFYVWKTLEIVNLYKDAAGMWEYDKYRPLIASIVNLVSNIVLVKLIGIYGIVISTILSIMLVIFPWSTRVLFKNYFKKGYFNYFLRYLKYTIFTVLNASLTYYICSNIGPYGIKCLIIRGVICLIVPNVVYLVLFMNDKLFGDTVTWMSQKGIINSKITKMFNMGKIKNK